MKRKQILILFAMWLLAAGGRAAGAAGPAPQLKDYLSQEEADKIRDAETPAARIKLFVSFADDRLKKIQYEINRSAPERHRSDILNSLLNGYGGCMDDAADQIKTAQEKQADIRSALMLIQSSGKGFLEILQKLHESGPDLETYRDTLEDAIEGTKDAIADAADAEKKMLPAPVRRKQ